MKQKKSSRALLPALVAFILFSAFQNITTDKSSFGKVSVNDTYSYININQIFMYLANNGDGSHSPGGYAGLYWPGGSNAVHAAVYEDGLVWGGKINDEVRVNGSTYRHGLQAGKILEDGRADDPADPRYRVYKIQKGFKQLPSGPVRDALQKDYDEWPVEDGAPWIDVDEDNVFTRGIDEPKFIADQVLWCVSNDLDQARSVSVYGAEPIGLEIQTTVFGFRRQDDLNDIVFKKYLVINKGDYTYEDVVFGYWSDPDLGYPGDDYTGCDTLLNLGYVYNAVNDDPYYGFPAPAIGYTFLQGPIVESPADSAKFYEKWIYGYKNQGMTSFGIYLNRNTLYRDPSPGIINGSIQFYRNLTGQFWNGNPFSEPYTGSNVSFIVPGNPVSGKGWYEGSGWPGGSVPGERRMIMATGTKRNPLSQDIVENSVLTLAPGDSQEVVLAIVAARGTDNINSIAELKRKTKAARIFFEFDYNVTKTPAAPNAYGVSQNEEVFLYWENNTESYNVVDPLLAGKNVTDSTYSFEGYRIWQFSDELGSDPTLIGSYDIRNNVTAIYESQLVNGYYTQVPVITSGNTGLRRHLRVTRDSVAHTFIRNGTPYYFAVTAYCYSPNSIPPYVESKPQILQVRPGTQKIDVTYDYDYQDNLIGHQVHGDGHGVLYLKVADPDLLTGDTYRAVVNGTEENNTLRWSFINKTTGDTLDKNNFTFGRDTITAKFFDGFQVTLQNEGHDSLDIIPQNVFGVKSVMEIKNGSGPLEKPVNVIKHMNSTGDFKITAYGNYMDVRQNINPFFYFYGDYIGYDNYEIRFTEQGSEYYLYGYGYSFRGPVTDDPKAKNRVPFEIWNIGRDIDSAEDDIRLKIKIQDFSRSDKDSLVFLNDSTWSRAPNGNWEPIFAYLEQDSQYHDDLPASSGEGQTWFNKLHQIVIQGELPEEGTVIRITPWRPLQDGDAFEVVLPRANTSDFTAAKDRLSEISVFPNPYFGSHILERNNFQRFIRFTNLPTKVTVRIYSLAGVFVTKLEKDDQTQWLDWNLLNMDNLPVASGIYIAHLDMPGIGKKVMKIAIVQEKQMIERL